MKAVEDKLAEHDTSEKVTADETADVDRTEEVSKSENTIAEEEVNELKDEFCFCRTTEGLSNQPTTLQPVAPLPSWRGIRGTPPSTQYS